MDEESVYWKIFLGRDNLLTIVCMQWFDEYDYDQSRFYTKDGEIPKWTSEEDAKKYLNDNFRKEMIDPEFWGGLSENFWNSLRK